jgi:hypothetical protein
LCREGLDFFSRNRHKPQVGGCLICCAEIAIVWPNIAFWEFLALACFLAFGVAIVAISGKPFEEVGKMELSYKVSLLRNMSQEEKDEMNASMEEIAFQSRVRALRREAKRQGYTMLRTKSRNPRAVDYAHYHVADVNTNTLEFTGNIDEVDCFLRGVHH